MNTGRLMNEVQVVNTVLFLYPDNRCKRPIHGTSQVDLVICDIWRLLGVGGMLVWLFLGYI